MYSKRTLLWFFVISLFVTLMYVAVTAFVGSHAAKVISQVETAPVVNIGSAKSAACERAEARFQEIWDQSVDSGTQAKFDRALDAAQSEVDRACR